MKKSKSEIITLIKDNTMPSYLKIENLFYLMNIADDESLNVIFDVLRNDPCELVRHEAAFCLAEMASERSREVLKECFKNDLSAIVKHECLISLGTIGDRDLDLDFYSDEILNDLDYEVSCSAKIGRDRLLQENFFDDFLEKREDYEELLFDYKNTSQNDRIQILFQLMNVSDDRAVDLIYDVLKKDICRVVRHEAAFILGEIGTEKSVKLLMDGIENEKTEIVIHEGLFALGTSGRRECLIFISNYLDHPSYVISESAKIAMDRIEKLKTPYRGTKEFEDLK